MNVQGIPCSMSDFNTLCKSFENTDPEVLRDIMSRKLESVYDCLSNLPEKQEAVDAFGHFLLCIMVADGDFSRKEYDIINSRMDMSIYTDMGYEKLTEYMAENRFDDPEVSEKVIKSMIGIMGRLSQFDRDDVILCAFMVCGVDGDVSDAEKAILSRIMN